MSFWHKRSRENLFAHSSEQIDFATAVSEWRYSHTVTDNLFPTQTCELCEHPNLRYQYEIRNHVTGAILLIGSDCIKQFEIAVYDESGRRLLGDAIDERLRGELKERQRDMILEPIRELWRREKALQSELNRRMSQFTQREVFSPGNLAHLFRLLEQHGISYPASLYPVSLRRHRDIEELNNLPLEDLERIRPALSRAQLAKYNPARSQPPSPPTPARQSPPPPPLQPRRAPPPASPPLRPQPIPPRAELPEFPRQSQSSSPTAFQVPGLPDIQLPYDIRQHKFTVAFYSSTGTVLHYDFVGKEEEALHRLHTSFADYPPGTIGRVYITLTGFVVKQLP